MGLTWPQFVEISSRLTALRYRRALHEVFFGVAAALDRDSRDNLFNSTPDLLHEASAPAWAFTPEQLAEAERRAEEYLKETRKCTAQVTSKRR